MSADPFDELVDEMRESLASLDGVFPEGSPERQFVEGLTEAIAGYNADGEEPVNGDPRFGDPVGLNEVAGLAVAFKALVIRAGGRVEITEAELLHARTALVRVEADPEVMVVEVVEGTPPDVPRFDADYEVDGC